MNTGNPIKQDKHDDGSVRYYQYGNPIFNYGLIPQTWEDPAAIVDGRSPDNDPLDIIELGSAPLPVGTVFKAKVVRYLDSSIGLEESSGDVYDAILLYTGVGCFEID